MTKTLQELLISHKNAGIMLLGDRNDMEIAALESIEPSLSQIVRKVTRGRMVLDVMLTNLGRFYTEPAILPAIEPDSATNGVPSDH